ncbi:MAG: HPF/RaiA family ribosome-associated protein, partial [Ramlibacter sp.]
SDHLASALQRHSQDITRVEVQLSDENSGAKGAADKRCTLEARLAAHQPVAATHHAENQDLAFRGATDKLLHLLEHTLGKLAHKRDRDTIRRMDATQQP